MEAVSEQPSLAADFQSLLPEGPLLSQLSSLEYSVPTEVQAQSIPKALAGRDLIVQAKTGSGKTFAFVLPLLQRLAEGAMADTSKTSALFIAPTRELAVQIQDVLLELNPELQPVLIIGGVEEKKQRAALERDARLVVGTPGRLLDLLQRKAFNLRNCKYFVLDEADEMLSMGFIEDVRAILSRLPKQRQGLFVSATITPRVEMLANSFLSKAEYIVGSVKDDKPAIEHLYCEVGGELLAKPHALCDIIETQRPRSAIIFCNTKSDTQLVEVLLRRRGFDARRINSDLSQSQRQKVIAKIKSEELQLLVATDIAARGLDIEQLDLVINYSLHDQSETYVHRSGRTGRAGLKGRAISLVGPRDFGAFHYLTKVFDAEFIKMPLPTDEEVADARLAHLYEMLRLQETKVDTRAQLSARKLLRDHGMLENANDDLVELLSRLCEFVVAHAVAEETRSLDEELAATSAREQAEAEGSGGGRKKRDRSNKREGSSDDDEESRAHASQRPEKSDRSERPPREERETLPEKLRLYVGQGSAHGLSEESLRGLAQDFAEVHAKDISRISVRDQYSYLDAVEPVAQKILQTMNGIEHNGAPLPIEIATRFEAPRPQRQGRGRDRRDSRGGRGSRGGRDSRDRRRSGK